ncbi:MAG: ATP-binding protein [Syntrophaceae bacterium]|nr:ATP-binding protein [Syntrophaceae bacterium]
MKLPGDMTWHTVSPRYGGAFLRPLIVALVILLFLSLILVMGIMDLGRLDRTLVRFMENRGLDIVTTVENVAQENLAYLYQTLKEDRGDGINAFVPLRDEEFSPQEALVKGLVALARDIDNEWRAEHLDEDALRRLADRENLWLIAVLDEAGTIVFKSREFITDILPESKEKMGEGKDLIVDLFNRFGKLNEVGYIALRRKDGSGTILMALDNAGLRYWSAKIAIGKAIDDVGIGQGLQYLIVISEYGKVLGRAGELREESEKIDDVALDVLKEKLDMASRKTTFGGVDLLEITVPIRLDGKVAGFARVGLNRESSDRILRENRNRMIISTIFIMAIGILSMVAIYLNQKKYSLRMEEMGKRLQQAEKLSALGQLAAGVAHEIRNPLNAISMASQRIRREYAPAEEEKKRGFQNITGIIRDEIKRLNRIVEEFVIFSRSRRLEFTSESITTVLERMASLIREEADLKGIAIRTEWEGNDPLVIPMDVDKLRQAFYNLLKNAMEAITGQGRIDISARRNGAGRVSIRISDTGCGLTAGEIDHIFDPEYTTKEKGLGLGLALAHEIIRGHGGEIRVESAVGVGTTFDVLLPSSDRGKGTSDGQIEHPGC